MKSESDSEFEAGVFLVDKPEGASSFYMVRKVRKALGSKRLAMPEHLIPLPPVYWLFVQDDLLQK